jgi:predicted enzyme related to lactoylglutathione lyase
MGPDESYTMFCMPGGPVSAAYTMKANMQGVPPHWGLYIAVTSADETAAKATAAGGKVCAGPFDVMTFGRMAVLQDPTGATFMVWQPMQHTGIAVSGEPGTFCWADLNTKDQAAAAKFYAAVFGWEIAPGKDDSGYLHIKNGEHFIGGMPPAAFQDPNAPPHWLLYFLVADCDASTAKAKELGATVYMGPQTLEGVGRWSIVADPQGAVSSLFQALPH